MTAVLAAILAAFLAGAIALYRERRLESRQLKVAARVLESSVALAMAAALAASETPEWDVLDEAPGHDAFERVWEEHRDTLAGHLPREAWGSVQGAVRDYLLFFFVERDSPPNVSPMKDMLEEIAKKLEKARTVLHPYGG
jgi:hypothetical protein